MRMAPRRRPTGRAQGAPGQSAAAAGAARRWKRRGRGAQRCADADQDANQEAVDVQGVDAERRLHVDQKGVGVCGVYTYEIAETKVTQTVDYARKNQHPLQCTLEKE